MLVSENWLKEWVRTDLDAEALAEKLTLAGLEVEGIEEASAVDLSVSNAKKLVVARIISAEAHPDADRLRVCEVDAGGKRTLQIVCGAPNAATGLIAPLALPGAVLPGMKPGAKISRSEIRGIASEGMLCSGAELGLSDEADGLMALPADAKPGALLGDYLAMDDRVIEIDLTPNRGDCLSVQGIAREVSALTGARMKDTAVSPVKGYKGPTLTIELRAPALCSRFAGRAVTNIDMAAPTPVWMKEKLRRSGIRSINAVVDITAFVMLETGQPMHAYDLDKLSGGIVVRSARKKEKLKLLDGSTVVLGEHNLVIADHHQAIGLAGIMGGDNTAISATTSNIFFEAAFFAPAGIAGKARQLGMHTDASHRFERGVNPQGQVAAIERATALLLEISGGKASTTCHEVVKTSLPNNSKITLQASEIKRILGITVPAKSVRSILGRLGMAVEPMKGGWEVVAPPWRFDISGQHDLVEEVGRCYGYDHIAPRMPSSLSRTGAFPETAVEISRIRSALTDLGYFEAINYSFVDGDLQYLLLETGPGIRLTNPLADNMADMRQSLLPGLLSAVANNLNRQETRIRLFELGNVFHRRGKKRTETMTLSAAICGPALPRQWAESIRPADFFDIKGDLEAISGLSKIAEQLSFTPESHPALHPGRSAAVMFGGRRIGIVGQIHPAKQRRLEIEQKVYVFEIEVEPLLVSSLPKFVPLSRYPAVQRDLAVVVSRDVAAASVLELVKSSAGDQLKRLELFDIYMGERIESNKKSFAFSLTFQSESSNLKSADIEAVTDKIITALQQNLGAELRA